MSGEHQIPDDAPGRRRHEHHTARLLTAVALSTLVAGCAAANAATPNGATPNRAAAPAPSGAATASGAPMTSDMPMPMRMSQGTQTPGTQSPGVMGSTTPSATALMVCGPEIGNDVTAILALPSAPRTTATWNDRLYTCTYHVPSGSLVLSVKESPDTTSANTYFAALRQRWGTTRTLTGSLGLGNPGYETPNGAVAILKDDKTLQVDATGLPPASGPNHLSRTDLAYEIATDIIGCWNGK